MFEELSSLCSSGSTADIEQICAPFFLLAIPTFGARGCRCGGRQRIHRGVPVEEQDQTDMADGDVDSDDPSTLGPTRP
jgi:hypothetical protein